MISVGFESFSLAQCLQKEADLFQGEFKLPTFMGLMSNIASLLFFRILFI